jgi:glycosyltransferase involved in cell wall biosynthesis
VISFIIPTLNEEKVIKKVLNNLREIKTFSYEIIVSDGGSTDGTVELSKTIADKVISHDKTKGRQTISQGRNAGAAAATGDFLIFLDADVFLPDIDSSLSRALEQFKKNPKLVGLSGWVRVFPDMETTADYLGYVILSDWQFFIKNNLLGIGCTCGEFQMIPRKNFNQLQGYREDLVVGEDLDLFYRLSQIGQTRTDRKLLIYHTGRRPHKIGWSKLIWEWVKNWFYLTFFNKSHSKEWKVIR